VFQFESFVYSVIFCALIALSSLFEGFTFSNLLWVEALQTATSQKVANHTLVVELDSQKAVSTQELSTMVSRIQAHQPRAIV